MTIVRKTICSWPGCSRTIALPDRYCEKHKPLREAQVLKQRSGHDKWRGSSASRGYDYKWQKFRTKYLRLHPVCVSCGRLATEIDHIIPFGDDLSKVYEIENLQPLCHECHSRKTASENRVRPTKRNPGEDADEKLQS